jgi:hypothetical protein
MLVPWCSMLDDSVKTSVPHVAAHLDRLWRVPEVDEDLGDAVHALTTEFAARRGRIETTS